MTEQWRDIEDYEGLYQVSNTGLIRSIDRDVPHGKYGGTRRLRGRVLQGNPNTNGHLMVNLSKDGKQRSLQIHQLVAIAWLEGRQKGYVVRHGPKGLLDNSILNLCWGTKSDDLLDRRRDGTHGGRPVRRSDGKEYINLAVGAEDTGCELTNILKVCRGKRKSAGGFGWELIK